MKAREGAAWVCCACLRSATHGLSFLLPLFLSLFLPPSPSLSPPLPHLLLLSYPGWLVRFGKKDKKGKKGKKGKKKGKKGKK